MGVSTLEGVILLTHRAPIIDSFGIKKLQYQSHPYVSAEGCLLEVVSSRIVIYIYTDLVYSREGV